MAGSSSSNPTPPSSGLVSPFQEVSRLYTRCAFHALEADAVDAVLFRISQFSQFYFPLHPLETRHRIAPTASLISEREEILHAHAQLELAGDLGSRDIRDGGGIPMVFALALRKSVDARDGLRSERQSSDGGNEKEHWPGLWRLLCCQPGFRFHVGVNPPWASGRRSPSRLDGRVPRVARIRRHRAVHWRAVREAEHEAFRHQHWLPACMLPRHGSDPRCLELKQEQSGAESSQESARNAGLK